MSVIGWSGCGRTVERTSNWVMDRFRATEACIVPSAVFTRCHDNAAQPTGVDMPTRLPSLFLSHGSPMLAIQDSAGGRFLDGLGGQLPWPKAILVASAHFTADQATFGAHPQPPP